MPTPARSRARTVVLGAACALLVAVAAGCSSDSTSSSTTAGPSVIQSPATVTGGGATGSPSAVTTDIPDPNAAVAGLGTVQRNLITPGVYNCTSPGQWQPFGSLELIMSVGEPAPGSSCTGEVVDLPNGTCSTAACSAVPADWRIESRPGVSPESLLLVVAPIGSGTSEFLCVVGLIPQPKQILLDTTTMDQACPADSTTNSADLPYIPPDTTDIYVPPPASVDITGASVDVPVIS